MRSKILFALFFFSLAVDAFLVGPHFEWRMIPAAFLGWYTADLISGLVHMTMDYRPCRPGTGVKELYFWEGSRDTLEFLARQADVYSRISTFERIVYDFKKHHPMPDFLGRHGVFHLMKAPVFLVTLPASVALNGLFILTEPPGYVIVGVVVLLVGASLTQSFHGALHKTDVPSGVKAMRSLGLLMSPAQHKFHHDTLTRDFSVISGWSNPVVNFCARQLLRQGFLRADGLEPT